MEACHQTSELLFVDEAVVVDVGLREHPLQLRGRDFKGRLFVQPVLKLELSDPLEQRR